MKKSRPFFTGTGCNLFPLSLWHCTVLRHSGCWYSPVLRYH